MLTQFPEQVLVVRANSASKGEDDVEEPRHRLNGVQSALGAAAVPVRLQGAVREVDTPVEAIMGQEDGLLLLRCERRLPQRCGLNASIRPVKEDGCPSERPPVPPV